MANPVKLIDILSEQTVADNMRCDDCDGSGDMNVFHAETGMETMPCETCLGSGYNQLGLILQGVLKPPSEGYGPVEVRDALDTYMQDVKRQEVIQDTQRAIAEAQQAIAETQEMIAQAQELIHDKSEKALSGKMNRLLASQKHLKAARRRIS